MKCIKCIIGNAAGVFTASAALHIIKIILDMPTRSEITECMDVSTSFLVNQLDMMSLFNTHYPKEGSYS